MIFRNEARRKRLKNYVRMVIKRHQRMNEELNEMAALGQKFDESELQTTIAQQTGALLAPTTPDSFVMNNSFKGSTSLPPEKPVEPAPKTRAEKARELYNADRYSELHEFKRLCKKSWSKLGFTAYEQFEIENNIHN